MADAVSIIQKSFELYKANWKAVIAPFALLLVLSIIFGAVSFGISLTTQVVCQSTNDPYVLITLCYFPQILESVLGLVEELVGLVVIMAVLVPLWGIVSGNGMGDWVAQLGRQLVNAILVAVVKFLIMIVAVSPLIIFIVLNVALIAAAGNAVQQGGYGALLAFGGIAMIAIVAIVTVLLVIIVSFLMTFFEIEVAVGGKGVLAALSASANLVIANFMDALVFNVVWWFVGIGIAVLTVALMCTVCLIPLAWVIPPLVVTPVMWISKLMLWRELGGPGKKR